jgi:hypothetical protein
MRREREGATCAESTKSRSRNTNRWNKEGDCSSRNGCVHGQILNRPSFTIRHGGMESTPLSQSPSACQALKMKKPHLSLRIRTVGHWKQAQ